MSSEAGSSEEAQSTPDVATNLESKSVEKVSLVEYYGLGENSCGYCKTNGVRTSNSRLSYDMRAHTLTAADYQDLLDRGWRRSGNYCYHPVNGSSCCPNYPIQCKPLEFKFSRSQRRCIERMNQFLVYGEDKTQRLKINYNISKTLPTNIPQDLHLSLSDFDKLRTSTKAKTIRFVKRCERKARLCNIKLEEAIAKTRTNAYTRARRKNDIGSIEDYLFPTKSHQSKEHGDLLEPKHKLEMHFCHVDSKFSEELREKEHEIIRRYQRAIHEDKEDEWDMSKYCNFLVKTPIITEKLSEKFDYVDWPNVNDDNHSVIDRSIDQDEYLLVKPPELPTAYGTHHCSYHLDGKLIAVGVLDLLPKCLTTVYFFYDPNFGHLNLGNYSALVEISIVRQMARHFNGPGGDNKLVNYNLGYYVHECKKMHYKTKFRPAYLLCSETCTYVPIDLCLDKLRTRKYARFNTDSKLDGYSVYTAEPTVQIMLDVPITSPVTGRSRLISYVLWLQKYLGPDYANIFIDRVLLSYIRLVGETLVPRMILQLETIHRALVRRHDKIETKKAEPKERQTTEDNNESSQSDSD